MNLFLLMKIYCYFTQFVHCEILIISTVLNCFPPGVIYLGSIFRSNFTTSWLATQFCSLCSLFLFNWEIHASLKLSSFLYLTVCLLESVSVWRPWFHFQIMNALPDFTFKLCCLESSISFCHWQCPEKKERNRIRIFRNNSLI